MIECHLQHVPEAERYHSVSRGKSPHILQAGAGSPWPQRQKKKTRRLSRRVLGEFHCLKI